jgi:hypothetical protein
MTKKTIQEEQQPILDENSVSEPEESTAFLVQDKPSIVLITIVLLVVLFVGVGFFFSYSSKPQHVVQEFEQVADTATESAAVETSPTPSPSPIVSPSPTYKPVAEPPVVEEPAQPSPSSSEVEGVDMRFSDVHFYYRPEPNTTFTPYRIANGSSAVVINPKNASEFELFAMYVNHGNKDSGNVKVHYYVDGVEVKTGLASLPGNMAKDELVTRDSAQPVAIPSSGSHQVKIVIDSDNESGDVDVSNNTYSFRYTVQ